MLSPQTVLSKEGTLNARIQVGAIAQQVALASLLVEAVAVFR